MCSKTSWALGDRIMSWSLLVFWIPHGIGFFLTVLPTTARSFISLLLFFLQHVFSLFFFFLPAVFSFSSLWESFTTYLHNSNQQPVKVLWDGTATKEHVNNFSKNHVLDVPHTCLWPLEWTSGILCALKSQEHCACWD